MSRHDDRADALAYAQYSHKEYVKGYRSPLGWYNQLPEGMTAVYSAPQAQWVILDKNGDVITHITQGDVIEGRHMGILDDLKRMEEGETLASAMGLFDVGDRVAMRPFMWDQLQSEIPQGAPHLPREDGHLPSAYQFGTVVRVSPKEAPTPQLGVKHDGLAKVKPWHPAYWMSMETWIGRYDHECDQCGDTGYVAGHPDRGTCPCQDRVDYSESTAEFVARRKARRARKEEG